MNSDTNTNVDHAEFRKRLRAMRNNRSTQRARNEMHKKNEQKNTDKEENGDIPPPLENPNSALSDLSPEMQQKLQESVRRVAMEEQKSGNKKAMSQQKLMQKVMEDFNKNNS